MSFKLPNMHNWYLSEYFAGVAMKKLSLVEIDIRNSHQHEFNGTKELKKLIWEVWSEKKILNTTFLYLDDTNEEVIQDKWQMTWYDARAKSSDRTWRSEYRLYFPQTLVTECADVWDLLIIWRLSNWEFLVIIAEWNSTISSQLQWLFWITQIHPWFSVRSELETEQDRLQYASRAVLEAIWIEVEISDETFLDNMIKIFWTKSFPDSKTFSEYTRNTLKDSLVWTSSDDIIMLLVEREEILFRTFEKYLLADRLSKGFLDSNGLPDTDWFIKYSLWVQNRRKSRVWLWFENQLEFLFESRWIRFCRTQVTENKSKPDFLFPWIKEYKNLLFPTEKLTFLWAKTSCKDRWRQVLSEANRIENKHLITLETAISETQTIEMKDKKLQLVIPKKLQSTYSTTQRDRIISLDDFIKIIFWKDK